MENGHKSSIETVSCKRPQPCVFGLAPLDLLGRRYRWPEAPSLDREVWTEILWREV